MMKTVKREANVGERILITNATMSFGKYANGDVKTVERAHPGGVYVKNQRTGLFHAEYEVIVAEQKPAPKSARITALETEVSALKAKVEALEKAVKYPLTARFDAEITAKADAILADIKRKATPQTDSVYE